MEDSYVLQMLTPKFKDFHLCFCGYSQCEPMHSYEPAVRPNYIIHYAVLFPVLNFKNKPEAGIKRKETEYEYPISQEYKDISFI